MASVKRATLNKFIDHTEEVLRVANSNAAFKEQLPDNVIPLFQQRNRTARAVRNVVGGEGYVFQPEAANNTLGFVETANPVPHVLLGIMHDTKKAVHVATHERTHRDHIRNGIKKLHMPQYLLPEQISAAAAMINTPEIEDINLIEGFTELSTITERGSEEPGIAYLKKEVPVARALNKLAKQLTGRSLLQTFRTGNETNFFDHLLEVIEAYTASQQAAA